MNIIIVNPGHPTPQGKTFAPALTTPYLAALATPYAKHIKIYDLAVEKFDFTASLPDIAMFTTTMGQSDHIFSIAKFLKEKGVKIFLGGPHATLAYHWDPRIKEVADCVVLGEGEKALPRALEDFQGGRLQPTYSMPIDTLDGIPFTRLDLLTRGKYYASTVAIGTRGCVHSCAFCIIRSLYGQKYLKRPMDQVIEEIKFQTSQPNLSWLDRKLIILWDDNPAADLEWFHDLLERLIPLKKWWLGQMCLNVADNPETVKLMKAAGCKGIFVGLESISQKVVKAQKKGLVNTIENYKRQLKTLIKNDICVVAAIMFGFDDDTYDGLFKETLAAMKKMGVSLIQGLIFTPYPCLECYAMLEKENRIITREAKYYNGYTVVHQPRRIHPADLQEGVARFRKEFYSWPSILHRMTKHNLKKMPEFILWNRHWRKVNSKIIPEVDPQDWLDYLRTLKFEGDLGSSLIPRTER